MNTIEDTGSAACRGQPGGPVAPPRGASEAGWAVQCIAAVRSVLRPAIARVRAMPSQSERHWDLRYLDDRLLRDTGIDPSTVPRAPVGEHWNLLFTQWLR